MTRPCCMTSDGSLISDMSYCSGYRGHRSDLSLRVRKGLNYISLFVHPLTSEVSWVTPDLYWEHIKSQIDVELWFSWTPRNYYCTVPSQLDVTSMDFLSLKAALSAAGGFFLHIVLPEMQLWSLERHRCAVACLNATTLKCRIFAALALQSVF